MRQCGVEEVISHSVVHAPVALVGEDPVRIAIDLGYQA
jgi:hypothetical protein